VALKVGTRPETGELLTSFRVIETVDVATPLATTGPVPVMVEFAATTETGVKITVPSDFENGETRERVFVSAVPDLRVQVEIPETPVMEQAP
jgi:hypothetical protein